MYLILPVPVVVPILPDPEVVSSLPPAVASSHPDAAAGPACRGEDEDVHLALDDSGEFNIGQCGACSRQLEEFANICDGCNVAIHPECGNNGFRFLCNVSLERF